MQMHKMVFATKRLANVTATKTKKADSVIVVKSVFGISRDVTHVDAIIWHNLAITIMASVLTVVRIQRETIANSEYKDKDL